MNLEQIRLSLRTLARHKRFSITAIVCLGLAVSLNTTMYSVLDAVISPSSDVVEPERIVYIQYYGDYRGVIQRHDRRAAVLALSFVESATMFPYMWGGERMVEHGSTVREAYVSTVASNYFAVMGIRAKAGRLIGPGDLGSSARPVIMTERMWQQLFPDQAFEPASVFLNGEARAVVGLLSSTALPGDRDIWELLTPTEEANRFPTVLRMKRGVTQAQAEAELAQLSQRWRQITGEGADAGWLLRAWEPGRWGRGDWGFNIALIGSVLAVLLIACANLANMQLARGVSRARELATRAAVGASRRDLVLQLVSESAWLAAGGLVLSAVLTFWGIQLIEHFVPKALTRYMAYPQVSWRVMLVAVGATLLCLILVGLLPAIRLSRVNIHELMKSGTGTGKTVSARRQYGLLVVTEVALALAILCSAGLLVRSALQVQIADYTEQYAGNVYASVSVKPLPGDKRTRYEWSEQLIRQALTTDSATRASTRTCTFPTRKAISTYDAAGQPANFFAPQYCYSLVSSDYFRISRQRIVQGRNFSSGEVGEVPVIVDMRAARTLWKDASPIGKQIKLDSAHTPGAWYRVIGVVEPPPPRFNSRQDMALLERPGPNTRELIGVTGPIFSGEIYVLNVADTATAPSTRQQGEVAGAMGIALQVASRGDGRAMPLRLYAKMSELGPNVIPSYPRTFGQISGFDTLKARHNFIATLFLVFGAFGTALAALGVYAIIAHMVAQRTREFGVRIAIGAGERDIRQMVLREGNVLTLSGIAIGLLLTYKSAGYVRAFVFSDWDRYDSRVFGVVVVVLFLAAWLASYLPARRAMRINPVEALRND